MRKEGTGLACVCVFFFAIPVVAWRGALVVYEERGVSGYLYVVQFSLLVDRNT